MADINRIKQLADEEVERPDDYVSLERIVSEIPMLDYNNPNKLLTDRILFKDLI